MNIIDRPAATHLPSGMLECVEACMACLVVLRAYARSGARAGPGSTVDRALWRLMLDCAEVCEATASFLRAESTFPPQLTESCTQLCDECAAACESAAPASPGLEACSAACRRGAKACFALRGLAFRPTRPASPPRLTHA